LLLAGALALDGERAHTTGAVPDDALLAQAIHRIAAQRRPARVHQLARQLGGIRRRWLSDSLFHDLLVAGVRQRVEHHREEEAEAARQPVRAVLTGGCEPHEVGLDVALLAGLALAGGWCASWSTSMPSTSHAGAPWAWPPASWAPPL
jgi:hypothetical protein